MIRVILLTLFLLNIFTAAEASVRKNVKQGAELFQKGNYTEARNEFNEALQKNPNSPIINYDLGAALYKEKDYNGAFSHFKHALVEGDDTLKQKAYYNLGNTLYQIGIGKENEDIESAIKDLEKALEEYEKSMVINPKDENAENNYDFVKKEIERLKKKEQQQPKQGGNDNQKRDKKDQQKQQKKEQSEKESQEQDQSQSDQQNQKSEGNGSNEGDGQTKQDRSGSGQDQNKQDSKPKMSPRAQSGQESKMNADEAERMLDDYQQTEEPKELLNLVPNKIKPRDVEKDW